MRGGQAGERFSRQIQKSGLGNSAMFAVHAGPGTGRESDRGLSQKRQLLRMHHCSSH